MFLYNFDCDISFKMKYMCFNTILFLFKRIVNYDRRCTCARRTCYLRNIKSSGKLETSNVFDYEVLMLNALHRMNRGNNSVSTYLAAENGGAVKFK